jgi:hypothetical protein
MVKVWVRRPQSYQTNFHEIVISASDDGGSIIRVPQDARGRKFSVEFNDDLYSYRSNGTKYVSSGGSVVGV